MQSPRNIYLLYLYGCGVTAPPFGLRCKAVMVLAALPASVRAAPVSFAALHSTAPHFRFITPRSLLNIFASRHGPLARHNRKHTNGHMSFAANNTAHWVPLRSVRSLFHFSPAQSTRCQLFSSPAIPTSAAFSLRMLIAHVVPPFAKHR